MSRYLRGEYVAEIRMDVSKIRTSTKIDPVLSKVYKHIQSGWPNIIEDSAPKQYMLKRDELIPRRAASYGVLV